MLKCHSFIFKFADDYSHKCLKKVLLLNLHTIFPLIFNVLVANFHGDDFILSIQALIF